MLVVLLCCCPLQLCLRGNSPSTPSSSTLTSTSLAMTPPALPTSASPSTSIAAACLAPCSQRRLASGTAVTASGRISTSTAPALPPFPPSKITTTLLIVFRHYYYINSIPRLTSRNASNYIRAVGEADCVGLCLCSTFS